jgi:hypothetical protein
MHLGTIKSVNPQSYDRKPVMGRALRGVGLRRSEWPTGYLQIGDGV